MERQDHACHWQSASRGERDEKDQSRMSGDIGDRWTGQGQFVTDSGSTVMYSGSANAAGGVAVILNKQWGDSLLSYNPVSDRIMTVRVQASRWNLTLIQVYAPTNQATELEKDTFYQELEDVYEGCPKQGIVLVRGNFNAKIGERAPIGKYSMGVRNDNGDRLIQFAQANGLCACQCVCEAAREEAVNLAVARRCLQKSDRLLPGPPTMDVQCWEV